MTPRLLLQPGYLIACTAALSIVGALAYRGRRWLRIAAGRVYEVLVDNGLWREPDGAYHRLVDVNELRRSWDSQANHLRHLSRVRDKDRQKAEIETCLRELAEARKRFEQKWIKATADVESAWSSVVITFLIAGGVVWVISHRG